MPENVNTHESATLMMSTPTKPAKTNTALSPVGSTTTAATMMTSPASSSCDGHSLTNAEDWYGLGERVWYDADSKQIVEEGSSDGATVQVFHRVVLPQSNSSEDEEEIPPATPPRWMTFLPNNPEGSYGFHAVEEALCCPPSEHTKGRCDTDSTEESVPEPSSSAETTERGDVSDRCAEARLYLDYQGQGDSDSLYNNFSESVTKQRADLVEALWEKHSIQRTVVVSAGDSSLVTMELLQRQRQRLAAGTPFPKILHVLALNGRYVAKTRHGSQLATVTQLLRSGMGPSLAAKAQKSDFTLSQCLHPYIKGSSRSVRKQVASIIRRHNHASSLVDMARTVDDHLDDKHRYRWHLPHLIKAFAMDQGITFHLVTSNSKTAKRHSALVQQQLEDYGLNDCPSVRYTNYEGRGVPTCTFLLDGPTATFEAFLKDVRRLAAEEIPLSDNSAVTASQRGSSFDNGGDDSTEGEDSWHSKEDDLSNDNNNEEEAATSDDPAFDSRLFTEIEFDPNSTDNEEPDLF